MISSTSSSSRRARALAVLALAAACACAGPAPGRRVVPAPVLGSGALVRVALLPLENFAGVPVPERAIAAALEDRLARAGLEAVSGARVREMLARHRIRYTGGVDGTLARAAREDLEVDAIVLATLELYDGSARPRFGASIRLVSAEDAPRLLWIDALARSGAESPGLLGLGLVQDIGRLQDEVLGRLAGSLAGFVSRGGVPAGTCPAPGRFAPRVAYRSPKLDPAQRYAVAVLPFLERNGRRGSGEILTLEVLRQLHALGAFEVAEPGVVRAELLSGRVILEGGASLDAARAIRGLLEVDLIVTGVVRDYDESGGGASRVSFSVYVLDARTNELVWHSTSSARGDDGVVLFDLGRIETAPALACRMARSVADGLAAGTGAKPPRG